jgi:hypothetical protein
MKKSSLDMLVIDHIESGAERALPILRGIGARGRVETGKPQVAGPSKHSSATMFDNPE